MKYDIFNANTDLGVHVDGSRLGPSKIIDKINKDNISNIYNINCKDIKKDKNKDNLKKNLNEINSFNLELYNKVKESKNFPIIIGGDHSLSIGSALGSLEKNKNLGIIWIDAHGDFNTFETTLTGNLHGLPFATIVGYKNDLLREFTRKTFNIKNAVLVGARSLDKKEIDNLKDANIKVFTTNDIKAYGIKYVMDEAYKIALNNTDGIHISYDLDIIDPSLAKGVSVKEENGINENEAYQIMDYLKEHKSVIKSLDLVEYNPLNDIDNKTLEIATNLINNFIKE